MRGLRAVFGGAEKLGRRLVGSSLWVGVTAVTAALAVFAVLALVYLRPPGQQTIRFEITDAAALSTGDDVRVAGIRVGEVSRMSLKEDSVEVVARIDDDVFVGDRSRIEVRMRTPVGGYSVNLIPLGNRSAPGGRINDERITVPYSVNDVLQRVPTVTDEVDSPLIEANLGQLAEGLDQNPDSIRTIVAGMSSVADVLEHQRGQIDRIMDMSGEYLESFEASRAFVFELIKKIDIVISTYNNNSVGFNETYRLFASLLWRLQPLEKYYLDNAEDLHEKIRELGDLVQEMQSAMDPTMDGLAVLRERFAEWLTPAGMAEFGGGIIDMSQVCVPLPGRDC